MKKKSSDELSSKGPTLKGKSSRRTPNIEHRTSNIESKKKRRTVDWSAVDAVVNEAGKGYEGRKYDLEERLLSFAATSINLADSLPNTKAGNHISGQLLRSGTSPLANHGEAEAAESRKDFLHKIKICLKELRETNRWLRLIDRLGLGKSKTLTAAVREVDELIRIFVASVRMTLRVNEMPSRAYGRQEYDLEERLLVFAASIARLADLLPNTKAGNHVASRLLHCGTSPLANHGEAESAESLGDFLHKLRICLKELRQTNRWLRLIDRLGIAEIIAVGPIVRETDQLIRIFVTSIRTTRSRAR